MIPEPNDRSDPMTSRDCGNCQSPICCHFRCNYSNTHPYNIIHKILYSKFIFWMGKKAVSATDVSVGDYRYLPCLVLPSRVQRNIYFKRHNKTEGSTIFVTNLPPGCPVAEIFYVFSQFGSISSIDHGSLNKQPLGKVKSHQTTKQITKIDLNLNINVGRSHKEDYDLKYKKLNDIKALEARRAEIRRAIRESL